MAPEQWAEQPLGQYTSVWSIGLIGYELLSYGRHAVGEASKDWHARVNPQFNRWQKKQMWRKWIEEGAIVRIPLENSRLDALIKRCLNVNPARRPGLDAILAELLTILHELNPSTSVQCQLILDMPESGLAYDDEWPYRDGRLIGFERALQREYPRLIP
jgi:serine/threonine protein kinase